MRICHGLTGEVVEADDQELQWRGPLELAQQRASERWDLAADDLIALASDSHGTAQAEGPTGSADFGTSGEVFLFPRGALDPAAEILAPPLTAEPMSPRQVCPEDEALRRLSGHGDPAIEAFRSNIEEARRRVLESRPAAAIAKRVEERLRIQALAARAVMGNLVSHRETCGHSLSLLTEKYERVQERLDQSLAQVEISMAAMQAVTLHPALCSEGRESLADAVPSERIARFTANLQAERARLGQRLEKLRQRDAHGQALCEQVVERMEQLLGDTSAEATARTIREEHARAEGELLPALCELVPLEGASAHSVLGDEKRSAGALEGLAQACGAVSAFHTELQAQWGQRYVGLVQRIREVSYVQSKVRDVERQAALLEEEINAQRGHSHQLGHLQKMPQAYHRMLAEVARRRQFRERYLARCERVRAELARMVEEENGRRRAFFQRHGRHLPADISQGLGALAPVATLELPEFDASLPDIDLASLREIAELGPGGLGRLQFSRGESADSSGVAGSASSAGAGAGQASTSVISEAIASAAVGSTPSPAPPAAPPEAAPPAEPADAGALGQGTMEVSTPPESAC